jgi:hypothetical protein
MVVAGLIPSAAIPSCHACAPVGVIVGCCRPVALSAGGNPKQTSGSEPSRKIGLIGSAGAEGGAAAGDRDRYFGNGNLGGS